MKPRNEYQRRIVNLSAKLPGLTTAQEKWGADHCFGDVIYRTGRSKGWCTHCGNSLRVADYGTEKQVCPHCGAELAIKDSKCRVFRSKSYLTLLTTISGSQVCRHFFGEKYIKRGCQAEYEWLDCVQNWIDEDGKETIIARNSMPSTMYYDVWDWNSELSIKNRYSLYGSHQCQYDIDGWVYPRVSLIPQLKRNGFDRTKLDRLPIVNQLMTMLLTDPEAELLMKWKQYDLLNHKWRKSLTLGPTMETVKVATRHHYFPNDASMWLDHIELLQFFGKDIHNPHYICPLDLSSAHNRLVAKKRLIDEREKLKRNIASAAQWESQYRADKAPYLSIVFGNENIIVTVVQSVAEMVEEGSAMHHCVFANGYYKKADSLILTAKDKDGHRIETIEVSLKTFEVVQSRGKLNQNSEWHDEIVNLVKSNIDLIRKAA
ncbi:MAG: PcfJ domain-containing protein [Bacteroides sp.]|nr:PcfJ domain-containing protein [Bacteroides sp.]